MITALKSGSITILINHYYHPMSEKGKWILVDGSNEMIKTENKIGGIEIVVPNSEGIGANIISLSMNDIKKIYDTANEILKEIPPPALASDYDY